MKSTELRIGNLVRVIGSGHDENIILYEFDNSLSLITSGTKSGNIGLTGEELTVKKEETVL